MILETVNASSLIRDARIDSKYFLSPGVQAAKRIQQAKSRGVACVRLGGEGGIGRIWQPNRFTKVEAAEREQKAPYLRPYDVFEYLPRATEFLSVGRSRQFDKCVLRRGMLLQSCSGRNLGPAVFVDSYLEQFVVGSDMIRIEIEDESLRSYVLAYLQSATGQQLLTQGKTGSVIDHVSRAHIESLQIPIVGEDVRALIVGRMTKAIKLREQARLELDVAISEFESSLPSVKRNPADKYGWTVNAKRLNGRLDASHYDPLVSRARKTLGAMGGVRVDAVALVRKPSGRYRTYYVDREYGRPILSGTQLLQARPINLRYIASRAFKDSSKYEIRSGWIAYQADGRAEEGLGFPVVVTPDRDGWLASGHVGRVIPKNGGDLGWLYLALRSRMAQMQLKSLASGSVVDSTFEWDMQSIVLPPKTGEHENVRGAWEKFAEAQRHENEAIAFVEQSLAGATSSVELEFLGLVDRWRRETGMLSITQQKANHEAYQGIIRLGRPVLPFIFRELNKKREHWLLALRAITGEDPADPNDNFKQATEAWLKWGRLRGYL